jgi:molybdate transport system regulatory protein
MRLSITARAGRYHLLSKLPESRRIDSTRECWDLRSWGANLKLLTVRLRVDFSAYCAIGPGKIRLLECIANTGSLSQAAREMEMSYRRAWLLLDSLNTCFSQPVVSTQTGGKDGGGAKVTEFGQRLINNFRELELQVAKLAAQQMSAITRHVSEPTKLAARGSATVKRRSLVRAKRTSR